MTKFSGAVERRRDNREHGFTLIELLIVIVVLGILATIVVLAVGNVTSNSAVSACKSDAKSVQTAVTAYNAQSPTAIAFDTGATAGNNYADGSQAQQLIVQGTAHPYGQLQNWPASPGHYYIRLATGSSDFGYSSSQTVQPGAVLVVNAQTQKAYLYQSSVAGDPNGCAGIN